MRQSREEAARTRKRVVETAARAYRRNGIAGIGLSDVMAQAGLTHGGFYKHFRSKEALVAEAIATALEETRRSLEASLAQLPQAERLQALLDNYLSTAHRDRPERGCALAALGGEGARGGAELRAVLADGYRQLADLIAGQLPANLAADRREAVGRTMAASMVGILVLARALPESESESLLAEARRSLAASFVVRAAGEAPRHTG